MTETKTQIQSFVPGYRQRHSPPTSAQFSRKDPITPVNACYSKPKSLKSLRKRRFMQFPLYSSSEANMSSALGRIRRARAAAVSPGIPSSIVAPSTITGKGAVVMAPSAEGCESPEWCRDSVGVWWFSSATVAAGFIYTLILA